MAIRKDLDDMLNSLKSGTPSQPEKPRSELPKLRRKTKFDNMSVDDLLTAISEPEPAEPEPPAAPVVDEPVSISMPEHDPDHVFQFVQDDEPEIPKKTPEERHNIVINEELPDYEAMRQAQLEMDRLERERAAAAASFAAAKEHEHTASVDELQQFSARIAAENTAGKVAEDAAAALEQLAEFSAPKKKGFFSHFMNRDDWKAPYNEPEEPVKTQQFDDAPEYNAAPDVPQQPVYNAAPDIPQQPVYNAAPDIPQQPQYDPAPVQKSLTETALIEGIPVVGEGMDASAFSGQVKESLPEVEQSVADEQFNNFSEPEYIPEPEDFAANAAVSDFTETSAADVDDNVTTFYEETVVGGQPDDNEPQLDEYNNPSVDELMAAAIAAVNEEIAAEKEHEAAEEEAGMAVDNMIAGIREDAANAIADLDMSPSQADEAPFPSAQPAAEPEPEPVAAPEPAPEKPKGVVTSTLENILSEDPDDIINARSEKTEFDGFINKDSSRAKKILYTVLGVIFAALACVGLITVISKGIGFASRFASGESQKEKFAKAVYPAVIMDISDFQQPSELTSDQVITAAIWSMVMTDGALDKYERNFDVVTIPAVDVEAAAVKLFGDGLTELTHTNVGTGDAKFYYSEEKKSYNIQIHPIVYSYAPDIKSVTKNGNEYTVNVDYINELPSWLERTSTKSVVFTLVETNDGYQIRSMKVTSAKLSL